jgi:hypothetical protein
MRAEAPAGDTFSAQAREQEAHGLMVHVQPDRGRDDRDTKRHVFRKITEIASDSTSARR